MVGVWFTYVITVLISVPLQFQRLNSLQGGKLNTILPVKREHFIALTKALTLPLQKECHMGFISHYGFMIVILS